MLTRVLQMPIAFIIHLLAIPTDTGETRIQKTLLGLGSLFLIPASTLWGICTGCWGRRNGHAQEGPGAEVLNIGV